MDMNDLVLNQELIDNLMRDADKQSPEEQQHLRFLFRRAQAYLDIESLSAQRSASLVARFGQASVTTSAISTAARAVHTDPDRSIPTASPRSYAANGVSKGLASSPRACGIGDFFTSFVRVCFPWKSFLKFLGVVLGLILLSVIAYISIRFLWERCKDLKARWSPVVEHWGNWVWSLAKDVVRALRTHTTRALLALRYNRFNDLILWSRNCLVRFCRKYLWCVFLVIWFCGYMQSNPEFMNGTTADDYTGFYIPFHMFRDLRGEGSNALLHDSHFHVRNPPRDPLASWPGSIAELMTPTAVDWSNLGSETMTKLGEWKTITPDLPEITSVETSDTPMLDATSETATSMSQMLDIPTVIRARAVHVTLATPPIESISVPSRSTDVSGPNMAAETERPAVGELKWCVRCQSWHS